jgi:hypothetical protein
VNASLGGLIALRSLFHERSLAGTSTSTERQREVGGDGGCSVSQEPIDRFPVDEEHGGFRLQGLAEGL